MGCWLVSKLLPLLRPDSAALLTPVRLRLLSHQIILGQGTTDRLSRGVAMLQAAMLQAAMLQVLLLLPALLALALRAVSV